MPGDVLGELGMSLSICVIDPSRATTEIEHWGLGDDVAVVTGRLGGPELAAHLRPGIRTGSRLVVLHRPADLASAALVANVVSGALAQLAVTRLPVRSSLLGATVIGLEAARIEGESDGTRVTRLAGTLDGATSGAWLSRVTRLAAPTPSFGQHLRSLVPGGPRFIAVHGPSGGVVRAEPDGYDGPRTGQLVIGAPADSVAARELRAWYGSDDVVHVEPVLADARRVYGNAGAEFTVVTEALADPGPVVGTCPVCRDALHGTVCAFCHVHPRTAKESTA